MNSEWVRSHLHTCIYLLRVEDMPTADSLQQSWPPRGKNLCIGVGPLRGKNPYSEVSWMSVSESLLRLLSRGIHPETCKLIFSSFRERPAHNHSGLVRRGDNSTKKILVDIPCVMTSHGHGRPAKKYLKCRCHPVTNWIRPFRVGAPLVPLSGNKLSSEIDHCVGEIPQWSRLPIGGISIIII